MQTRIRRVILSALLVLSVTSGMVAWNAMSVSQPPPPPEPARVQAWEKVTRRLRQAEGDGAESGKYHVARVKYFFDEKRDHTRDFAEELLGWSGKWAFVKGKLFRDDGKSHQAFIRQAFERHLFTEHDLQRLMQSTVKAYLSELEGQENRLLVQVRADLSEEELPALRSLAALKTDDVFRNEVQKLVADVVPMVSRDLKVSIGQEAVVWVGSDIAAAVTTRIGSAVAVRLGVSGGILGTGAASGVTTFGVGLAVGFVVDGAVDWIMRQAGYDPAHDIACQTDAVLTQIETLLLDGDRDAHRVYKRLRDQQDADSVWFVRSECRKAADRVNSAGYLGLRHELNRLREQRAHLREAALKKLILEGGGR